jgi:hypothetical protein
MVAKSVSTRRMVVRNWWTVSDLRLDEGRERRWSLSKRAWVRLESGAIAALERGCRISNPLEKCNASATRLA